MRKCVFISGGSNYVKVKYPKEYESLLDECSAQTCLPDQGGRLRFNYRSLQFRDSGSIYFIDNDKKYFEHFMDKVPLLLEEGEVMILLSQCVDTSETESCLELCIIQAGQPIKILSIEPEVANVWKDVIDYNVEVNLETIQNNDELEKRHAEQKNEKRKEWEAERAKNKEDWKRLCLDHLDEFEKRIDDVDELPF